jgi:hypothetical protein
MVGRGTDMYIYTHTHIHTHTVTQRGYLIHLLIFFENMESRLKTSQTLILANIFPNL